MEEKEKKPQFGRERYKNLPEGEKQMRKKNEEKNFIKIIRNYLKDNFFIHISLERK